jgi:hypothetical protein
MLIKQNGVCAICRKPETTYRKSHIKGSDPVLRRLSVDHCHTTKKVRGLLCGNCNHSIGKMKDDPALLRAAADYLEKGQ